METENKQKRSKISEYRLLLILAGALLIFCLFFHVVIGFGSIGLKIFPKEYPTFNYTLVTEQDVQDLCNKHNDAGLLEGISMENTGVYKTLMQHGIIFEENNKNNNNSNENNTESDSTNLPISITLKALLDSFDYSRDEQYAMSKKYVGKVLCITGRTSGVDENGRLRLQTEPGENATMCYGISDQDFLSSIKEGDIVKITGILGREDDFGGVCVLKDCTNWEKLEKPIKNHKKALNPDSTEDNNN